MAKLSTVVVGAACLAAGAFLSRFLHDEPRVAVRTEVVKEYVVAPASSKAADTEMAVAIPFGQAKSALPAPAVAALSLRGSGFDRQLMDAKDLRVFANEALRHPEKGGAYYAALAVRECVTADPDYQDVVVQRIVQLESTIGSRVQAQLDALNARCANLPLGEIRRINREAETLGEDDRDPLMSLHLRLMRAYENPAEVKRLQEQIFARGSVTQASDLFIARQLLQSTMVKIGPEQYAVSLNGQTYTDPVDQRAIDIGATLSTCAENYCVLDFEVVENCIFRGQCYESRDDYLLRVIAQGDSALIAKARAFAAVFRDAMARGDVSIFR